MNFIQVLNNAEARDIVDQIEDLSISIQGNARPLLVAFRAKLIAELLALTGFQYTI